MAINTIVFYFRRELAVYNFVEGLAKVKQDCVDLAVVIEPRGPESWMADINWVVQDRFFLKPCCFFVMILLLARCLFMWLKIMCSITLQQRQVSEIGL